MRIKQGKVNWAYFAVKDFLASKNYFINSLGEIKMYRKSLEIDFSKFLNIEDENI